MFTHSTNPNTNIQLIGLYSESCSLFKKQKQKKTFDDHLLTPISSKMSMFFVLQSKRNEGF